MKIDTKHCTPIKSGSAPKEALLNPNDFILPENQEQHGGEGSISTTADSTEENIREGREQKYLLQLVYTPVLTSVRQPRTPESNKNGGQCRRLLDNDQMIQLNQHFEEMLTLLDPNEEEMMDPNNNVLTDEDENESASDKDGKPPALGRIIGMTNSGAPVSRSARLADKDKQAEEY
jgi:hypothetical protein